MLRTHLPPEAWRRPLPQEAGGAQDQSPHISFHRAATRSRIPGGRLRCGGGPQPRWLSSSRSSSSDSQVSAVNEPSSARGICISRPSKLESGDGGGGARVAKSVAVDEVEVEPRWIDAARPDRGPRSGLKTGTGTGMGMGLGKRSPAGIPCTSLL